MVGALDGSTEWQTEPGASAKGLRGAVAGDIRSGVLTSVRLCGAILPRARHVIEYRVQVEKTCWTRLADPNGPQIHQAEGRAVTFPHGDAHVCQSASNFDPRLECAPGVGHDHAADLTGARVLRSSNWMGLR